MASWVDFSGIPLLLLGRLLHLKVVHPGGGLGLGHDKDLEDVIDNLDAAGGQDLEQRHLLAPPHEAAGDRLDVALGGVEGVGGGAVPGQREDVAQVVGQDVGLAKGLDKVRLEVGRVQQHDGHDEAAARVLLVRHEADAGGLVLRVDGEAVGAGVVGLVDAADGQQGPARAVQRLDVARVQAQREPAVEPAGAVVAQLELARAAVDVEGLEAGAQGGDVLGRVVDLGLDLVPVARHLALGPPRRLAAPPRLLARQQHVDALGVKGAGVGPAARAEALVALVLEVGAVLERRALKSERLQRRHRLVVLVELRHEERRRLQVGVHLVHRATDGRRGTRCALGLGRCLALCEHRLQLSRDVVDLHRGARCCRVLCVVFS
ncbi:hypothetical protein BN1723_001942 [Verticillium longisporum]|uniref:Uncharacterized protein n=1 Tax=Verticillium longisporum TaxID=100787 RepID=A0A0G4KSC3_VERLO|nr:hypothetical protein BN1723_001942 [Verticillium longisporum]